MSYNDFCAMVADPAWITAETEPAAILVAVDGTAEGDFIVEIGHPVYNGQGGGESLLSQWQLDDLIERGYRMM